MHVEALFWLISLITLMPLAAMCIGLLFAYFFKQDDGPAPPASSFPPEAPTDPDGFNVRTQKVSVQTITEAEQRIAEKRRQEGKS